MSQPFQSLKKRRGRDDIRDACKVCVRPFTPIAKPKGKNKSWAYTNFTTKVKNQFQFHQWHEVSTVNFVLFQSDEFLEIFFYDEKKGGRGFTTGYFLPKQVSSFSDAPIKIGNLRTS